jgi:hypothetical protein
MCDLFDGRMERFAVREAWASGQTKQNSRCLTDGTNFIWVIGNARGYVSFLTRYGQNDPNQILDAIAKAFECEIVSEHEPQYWGFESEEALDAHRRQPGDLISSKELGIVEPEDVLTLSELLDLNPDLGLRENLDALRQEICMRRRAKPGLSLETIQEASPPSEVVPF